MKKMKLLILTLLLICTFGQITYGITYEEIREKHGRNVDLNSLTKEELREYESGESRKKYNFELGHYMTYDDFSRQVFLKAGYGEKFLERAEYLGFDEKMKEQCKEKELYMITRGNAMRFMFIFSGYDTKPYENLFQDKNLITMEEADELVQRIKPFVWNKEFENKEMWSDEDFIDYVNNNPDAHHFITTDNFRFDGKKIIYNVNGKEHKLEETITTIPDINERVFQMLKILSFHAVKDGGTATFFGDSQLDYCKIGYAGEKMDFRTYGAENFGIMIYNEPWVYKNIGTQVTFDFFRMYKQDRYYNSGGAWTGKYPEILRECAKALYREYYSDELFDYIKYIRVDALLEMDEEVEKTINDIYVYYRGEDKNQFIMTKIK